MKPTPIHKWALPGVPSGFQVSVKRDDLTGSTLTGNKVSRYLMIHDHEYGTKYNLKGLLVKRLASPNSL